MPNDIPVLDDSDFIKQAPQSEEVPVLSASDFEPTQEAPIRQDDSVPVLQAEDFNEKRPETLPYVGNQIARTGANILAGGQTLIGGVWDAVDPFTDFGERIMKSGDDLKEQAKESFGVTEQQQANASFPQKLTGALAAGAATLPLYASPMTAVAAVVFPGISTATSLIKDHNVSSEQATIIGAGEAAVNAAGYKVSTLFPSTVKDTVKQTVGKYLASAGGTGGVNVISGAANRAVTSDVLENTHPELAAKYKFLDWEQGAIDLASGIVMGPGMKYLHDKGAKTAYERLQTERKDYEKHQELLRDSLIDLHAELSDGTTPVAQGSGIGLRGAEKQLVRAMPQGGGQRPLRGMLFDNTSQYTVADYIADIQKSDLATDPEVIDLVKRIGAIGAMDPDTMARSYVFIHDGHEATSLEGITPGKPDFKIAVPVITDRGDLKLVAHELGHVATNGAIRAIENYRNKPPQVPDQKMADLSARWTDMETSFDTYRAQAGQDLLTRLQAARPDLYNTWGAIKDPAKQIFDPVSRKVVDWDNFNDALQREKLANVYGLTSLKEFIGTAFENYLPKTLDKTDPRYSTLMQGHSFLEKKTAENQETGSLNWQPPNHAQFRSLFKDAEELFSKVGKNSYLKQMWDGVFQLASGQSTMQVDPKAMQQRAMAMDHYTRSGVAEVANLLENAHSKDEFTTRLEAMSSLPEWRQLALASADLYWLNRDKIIAKGQAARKQINESMTGVRGRTESYATVDELTDSLPKDLANVQDLPDSANRWLVGPNQKNMFNLPAIAGRVLRFYHHQMAQYTMMGHKVYAQLTEHLQPLNLLPEKSRKRVLDFGYLVDGNYAAKQEMLAREIWWPDDAMITAIAAKNKIKLSPEEIHAYKELGMMEARAYTLGKAINEKNGQEPPVRIPGHMPHVWNGSYKVHVSQKKIGADGSTQHFKVRVMSFDFRQQAEAFAREVNSGAKYGKDFYVPKNPKRNTYWYVTERKDFEMGILSGMYQDIEAYKSFLLNDPESQARIMEMDNAHTINFNSHLTERADSDVIGHLGNYKDRNYTLFEKATGKKSRDYSDFLQVSEQYAKRMAETFKDTMFIYDIHNRMFKSGNADPYLDKRPTLAIAMSQMPTLSKHIHELVRNYTGVADNHFKTVDQMFIDASIKMGLPPYMYRQTVKGIRDIISLIFTRYNPGNWIMNYAQSFHTFGLMHFSNEVRRRQGLTTANVWDIVKEVASGKSLEVDEQKALAWARDNGINEPQAEHQVRKKSTTKQAKVIEAVSLGKIPNAIEGNSREMSYLIAYKYFRRIMEDPTVARQSAAELMGQTMINYDRSNRPLMYQSFGVVGEALSPFAVYRNGWMANTAMMVKFALQKPAEFNSWKPILASQAVFLAFAGMSGVIGISEYDAFIRWMKGVAPETFGAFPDGHTLLKMIKVPAIFRHGLLSEATKYFPGTPEGVNIGGSGSSVGADDMLAPNIVPFASALGSTFKIGIKALFGKEPTSQEVYETAVALLPGQARVALDKHYQEEGVKTRFHAGKLTGSTTATLSDDISQGLWGKPSLPTAEERDKIRLAKAIKDAHIKGVKNLVELAVDAQTAKKDFNKYYKDAYEKYGVEDDEFTKMITEKRLQRQLPFVESLFTDVDSLINDKQMQAIRELGGLRQ